MLKRKVPGTKYFSDEAEAVAHFGELRLFCGSACGALGAEISAYLNRVPAYKTLLPGRYQRRVFSNENIFIRLDESVRGQDVYLVQTLCSPVHDNLMEMLIMIDALKRDSAWRINLVVPYLAYEIG